MAMKEKKRKNVEMISFAFFPFFLLRESFASPFDSGAGRAISLSVEHHAATRRDLDRGEPRSERSEENERA